LYPTARKVIANQRRSRRRRVALQERLAREPAAAFDGEVARPGGGDDLSVSSDAPTRLGRPGSKLLVVGGTLYGIEPELGGWMAMGSPSNIDPGSGATPAEYLAAVREDVGGATLERITARWPAPRHVSSPTAPPSTAVR
jgi:hypothetical protein